MTAGREAFRDEEREDGISYQYLGLGREAPQGGFAGQACDRSKSWNRATPEIDARADQHLAPVRMCGLCLMQQGVSKDAVTACEPLFSKVTGSSQLTCPFCYVIVAQTPSMLSQVGTVVTQETSSVVLVIEFEVEEIPISRHSDEAPRWARLSSFRGAKVLEIQSEAGGNLSASCRVIGAMIRWCVVPHA